MLTRSIFTVITALLWLAVDRVVQHFFPLLQAQVAPVQVQNDNLTYGLTTWIVQGNLMTYVDWAFYSVLLMIWLPVILRLVKRHKNTASSLLVLMVGLWMLSGCGPARVEPIEEIGPNETAFVIPLEGDTKDAQQQFDSEEYLEAHKVAAKRIVIPVRSRTIGRGPGNYEWIPTVTVIRVKRDVVSREWVSDADRGTSSQRQGIGVESSESVDFTVGVVCSAFIEEQNAAKYLYNFKKDLSEVMDENVRRYMQQALFAEFSSLSLVEAQEQKGEVFDRVEAQVKEHFAEKGVTIDTCGGTDGLVYNDPKIQAAITANFEAQQAVVRAKAELEAQQLRNERLISETSAQAEATKLKGDAEAYVLDVRGQKLKEYPALVEYTMAESYDGTVPQTYVGSDFPLGMFMNPDGSTTK